MKKLDRLSYQQIEFVKLGFKKLGFQTVQVSKDKLHINGKQIQLTGYSTYPVYTNEKLQAMPLEELYDVAVQFKYNPTVHHARDYDSLLENLGPDIMRMKLKAFIYTRDENHLARVDATLQNGEEVCLTNMLDMANMLSECGISSHLIARSVIEKVIK